jgi:glycosyltransferase involved in cell wall biosynthesis
LPELVGNAGFVIKPTDQAEIAGAILSCLVDDALAAELRQRGPVQAARFSWARTARETAKVYREVASCGS